MWLNRNQPCRKKGNGIWEKDPRLIELMDIRCCQGFNFLKLHTYHMYLILFLSSPKERLVWHLVSKGDQPAQVKFQPMKLKGLHVRPFLTKQMSIQSQLPLYHLKVDSVGFRKTVTVQMPVNIKFILYQKSLTYYNILFYSVYVTDVCGNKKNKHKC